MRHCTLYSALTILLVIGCAAPRNTLTATEVIPVDSITEVLQCKNVGTVTAVVHSPGEKLSSAGIRPLNSETAADVMVDARNRARQLGGNRILPYSGLYKGSQQFMVFFCPEPSSLETYAQLIDTHQWQSQNLKMLCGSPGSAQREDFKKCCQRDSDGDILQVRRLKKADDSPGPEPVQLPPTCR